MAFPIIFGQKWSYARDAGKMTIWLSSLYSGKQQGRRELGIAVGYLGTVSVPFVNSFWTF